MKKRICQIAIAFLTLSILTISVGAANSNHTACQSRVTQYLIQQLECRRMILPIPTATSCPNRPVENPPVENPPVENPPVENPPVENPPVENPPVENPPVENPPVENPPVENPSESETAGNIQAYEMEVISLVNEIRAEYGLSALKPNEKLCEIARTKSQDMRENNYFAHNSPRYGSPFDMLKYFGVNYSSAGENIAYGYSSPSAVVEAWMNSQGHRENILRASFTEIGVGYVQDGHYWTQLFTG